MNESCTHCQKQLTLLWSKKIAGWVNTQGFQGKLIKHKWQLTKTFQCWYYSKRNGYPNERYSIVWPMREMMLLLVNILNRIKTNKWPHRFIIVWIIISYVNFYLTRFVSRLIKRLDIWCIILWYRFTNIGLLSFSTNTVNWSTTPIMPLGKELSSNSVWLTVTSSISRGSNSIFNDDVSGKTLKWLVYQQGKQLTLHMRDED